MKTPKHLAHLSADELAKLQTGLARFRFGFAEPGETLTNETCPSIKPGYTLHFIGNFARMKDAQTAVAATPGAARENGYLSGKLARGWSVWKWTQAAPVEA